MVGSVASIDPGVCGYCGVKKKWLFRLESYCPNSCDLAKSKNLFNPDWEEITLTDSKEDCPHCGSLDTEAFAYYGANGMHCIKCGKVW